MNAFRTFLIFAAGIIIVLIPFAYQAAGATAAGPKVSQAGNKHNLSAKAWTSDGATYSVSNTNTYRAIDDPTGNPGGQQICIFCHTPHNANVEGGAPLWNRAFSTAIFSRYSSGTLRIRIDSAARTPAGYASPAWQPDGSSKLCLSCHDGISSLGAVLRGGPIAMNVDVITSIASFNPSNNKMKTGHHPISFTYNATVQGAINDSSKSSWKFPPTETAVKLDKNSKMQCTTCHNAHQNQSSDTECHGGTCNATFTRKKAPFWVLGGEVDADEDRDRVCRACHSLDADVGFTAPWPTP